jgi:peptidoglycan-associated lipoprotein
MRIPVATMGLTLTVGMLLVMQGGCSKKSIQSGGDAQSTERGMAKSGGPAPSAMGSTGGVGGMEPPAATFPDLSLSSKPDDLETGGLRGFDSVSGGKAPSEERLGGGGTMLAKVEPSEARRARSKIFVASKPRNKRHPRKPDCATCSLVMTAGPSPKRGGNP